MSEALRVPNAHGSHHHSAAGASRGRLLIVFSLVVSYLVVEILGSLLTNSLALLADAGRRPASPSKSWGYLPAGDPRCIGKRATSCSRRTVDSPIPPRW